MKFLPIQTYLLHSDSATCLLDADTYQTMCLTSNAFDLRKTSNAIAMNCQKMSITLYIRVNLISALHITKVIIPILDFLHRTLGAIKDRNKATIELPVECDSCSC